MSTWVKYVLLVYTLLFIATGITVFISGGIPSKPISEVEWCETAIHYRDSYLGPTAGYCILKKTGMPPGPLTKAYALIICATEKFANKTDYVVDLIDVRAIIVAYCVDKGYFSGTYSDACAKGLDLWERACEVPYPLDCKEIISFIEKNHNLIDECVKECGY